MIVIDGGKVIADGPKGDILSRAAPPPRTQVNVPATAAAVQSKQPPQASL
jgi:hypothetical protein